MEHLQYDTLFSYLTNGNFPSNVSRKNDKDTLRRKAKNFTIKDDVMYFKYQKSNKECQVIPRDRMEEVLHACHVDSLGGGHVGRDKTLARVEERFYWRGMVDDVKDYCRTCDYCQRSNGKHKDSPGRLPIPQKEEVWHTIGVDLLGPLSETQRGNKYIVTASCLFSKWPEAVPLKERSSEGVAEFLFECFTRHGCCCIKISEEDSEFVEEVNNVLCRLIGVTSNLTSAHTQGTKMNSFKFNKTLQEQLVKLINEEKQDWDLYLDAILFSYRISKQDSTRTTPFNLVYGRQARLPLEFIKHSKTDKETKIEKLDLSEHINKMIKIRKRALNNTLKRRKCSEQSHLQYTVGALVLIRNAKKHTQKGSMVSFNWNGPFCIHKVIDVGKFQICKIYDCAEVLDELYDIDNLKLYHQRDGVGFDDHIEGSSDTSVEVSTAPQTSIEVLPQTVTDITEESLASIEVSTCSSTQTQNAVAALNEPQTDAVSVLHVPSTETEVLIVTSSQMEALIDMSEEHPACSEAPSSSPIVGSALTQTSASESQTSMEVSLPSHSEDTKITLEESVDIVINTLVEMSG